MPIPATHINEVLAELDIIVQHCAAQNSKLCLFAALYRKVTRRVKEGIMSGRFKDNARMECLCVTFANRYLEAYDAYCCGKPLTSSWQITFNASKNPHMFLIQHLFAGMNAHISLDLGIATAKTAAGKPLNEIEQDFNEINLLLAELIDDVQKILTRTSFFMTAVDRLVGKADEQLARFSLEIFRKRAWDTTNKLYNLSDTALQVKIIELDRQVMKENRWFTDLGTNLLPPLMRIAALIQNKKTATLIKAFSDF